MRNSLASRCLLVLALFSSPALAVTYSDFVVFGDSLSDTGNDFILSSMIHAVDPTFPIVPSPQGYNDSRRFSNGPVYADRLAQRLGFDLRPSRAGGTNYAYGGARTDRVQLPGSSSFVEQVQTFIGASGPADPDALYVVFIGTNDVQDALAAADPQAVLANAIGNIGSALGALAAEGARHFLVPYAADVGLVPGATGDGAIPRNVEASAVSAAFNDALAALLASFTTLDIVAFDTFGLLNEVVANPAAFGLVDVQSRCQREIGVVDGQLQYEILCTDEEAARHLYWDEIHPTTAAHRILADALFAALQVPEPGTLALLLAALSLPALRRVTNRV